MSAAQCNHPGARRSGRDLERQSAQQSGRRGQRSGCPATRPLAWRTMLMIKERLRSFWLGYKHLTELSFPRRFPIVQFPNLPLIIAFLAGETGKFLNGSAHSYAVSGSYLAMTIWAYQELADGVNWFRRLLGLAFVILLIVRVAHALHA